MQEGLVHRRGKRYMLDLGQGEREVLLEVLGELRALLIAESPSSDPAVARLFPPAYPDDLLQNLDYERRAGNGLLADRLAGLDDAQAGLGAASFTREQLMALMRSVNDVRLIYGVRLEITQESEPPDATVGPPGSSLNLYRWLGWLLQNIVEGLSADDPSSTP